MKSKTVKAPKANARLFNQLMKVCTTDEKTKFFFKDTVTGLGTKVRVFSYHIANYSDWLQPGALECRGILFELDANDKPVRIMSRPMAKFFNLGEHSDDLNTLCEVLINQGRLSKDVYEQAKNGIKKKTIQE